MATSMDGLEIEAFLGSQQTGILSLAKGDASYAIPVSYAFDEDGPYLYFRLGFAPGSQKRKFVDATDRATFVVYAETDEGWKSVVAEGSLEALTRDSLDSAIVEATKRLEIPFFSVHKRPARDLEFGIYRITVSTLNGLAEARRSR